MYKVDINTYAYKIGNPSRYGIKKHGTVLPRLQGHGHIPYNRGNTVMIISLQFTLTKSKTCAPQKIIEMHKHLKKTGKKMFANNVKVEIGD